MKPATKKSPAGKGGTGVPILHRTLTILDHLRLHPQGLTLSEIARELHFPKNTVYRILNTLSVHEYITRDTDSLRYLLSRKMVTFAYGSAQDRTLMESSLDVMRRLRDMITETVVISIFDRGEGIVLEQVQGLHPFRFVCDPGTRQPVIYASASTKIIFAFLPAKEREDIIKGISFKRMTATTITCRKDFINELAMARCNGYAVDRAEALHGVHCVATPVLNYQGYPVAAITTTGPAERMPISAFPRIGTLMKKYTAEISRRLGYGLNHNDSQNEKMEMAS
ncbi:MAG: IclR family transcriptional regulator [Kiritimatiellae bacterium]|nr:IclR family transcriptional regulator [Kiritimatiellia bacterium]MDD5519884.1 IclR family transcriptional regulator [Kiritimatiellia bacterium]